MPFTVEEFFAVFARYNEAIWPAPVLAYVFGLLVFILLFRSSSLSTIVISLVLSAMWAMNGIGYHWMFFAEVNPIARVFAAVFVVQAILLAIAPWWFSKLFFSVKSDAVSLIGMTMIVFAAALYPAWGALAGHVYPSVPVFGVAPCPTTIFTVGVLLMGNWMAVRWMLIIPTIWSAIGGSAVIFLKVPQDLGLIAALMAVFVISFSHWRGLQFVRHDTTP